jgi:hypothetical protein
MRSSGVSRSKGRNPAILRLAEHFSCCGVERLPMMKEKISYSYGHKHMDVFSENLSHKVFFIGSLLVLPEIPRSRMGISE